MSEEQIKEEIEQIGYQEFYKYYQEARALIEQQKQEIKRLNNIRKQALERIYEDWNDKNTIPIEQVGVSGDLRVKLFKILIEGEDKK